MQKVYQFKKGEVIDINGTRGIILENLFDENTEDYSISYVSDTITILRSFTITINIDYAEASAT